jgi:hypothetical protein
MKNYINVNVHFNPDRAEPDGALVISGYSAVVAKATLAKPAWF